MCYNHRNQPTMTSLLILRMLVQPDIKQAIFCLEKDRGLQILKLNLDNQDPEKKDDENQKKKQNQKEKERQNENEKKSQCQNEKESHSENESEKES